MRICPFCQQDVVWRVRLRTIPEHRFAMCFECDSVWLDGQPVSDQAGTIFEFHAKSLARVPDWNDIERIEMVG